MKKVLTEGVYNSQMQIEVPTQAQTAPILLNTGVPQGIDLVATSGAVWDDYANSDPLAQIQAGIESFRYSGFRPGEIIMNSKTWKHMINSEKLRNMPVCCDIIQGLLLSGVQSGQEIQLPIPGMPGIVIDDTFYLDDSGAYKDFIPEGKVIYRGVSAEGIAPSAIYDCTNVDTPGCVSDITQYNDTVTADCDTYGSVFTLECKANPAKRTLIHSWKGAPIIEYPAAYYVQTVCAPTPIVVP